MRFPLKKYWILPLTIFCVSICNVVLNLIFFYMIYIYTGVGFFKREFIISFHLTNTWYLISNFHLFLIKHWINYIFFKNYLNLLLSTHYKFFIINLACILQLSVTINQFVFLNRWFILAVFLCNISYIQLNLYFLVLSYKY